MKRSRLPSSKMVSVLTQSASWQVELQAPPTALALSLDASRCVVSTADGSLGAMDLRNESYSTLLRSHTSAIVSLAVHPTRHALVSMERMTAAAPSRC